MPTYSYECETCGGEFELFQKMSDPPADRCPRCGGARVRRRIGPGAGLIFKGSGFYITDYRSPEYRRREKSEKGGPTPGGTGGSGGSEKGPQTPSAPAEPRPSAPGNVGEKKE